MYSPRLSARRPSPPFPRSPSIPRREFNEKRKPSPLSYSSDSLLSPNKCEWVPVELRHASDVPSTPATPEPTLHPPPPPCRKRGRTNCLKLLFLAVSLALLGGCWCAGIKIQMERTIRDRESTASVMLSQRSLEIMGNGVRYRQVVTEEAEVRTAKKEKRQGNDILVVYSYTEARPMALQNADYFIENAVHSGADFVFVVNGEAPLLMPKLESKAMGMRDVRVLRRAEKCERGFGAYGDGIRSLSTPEADEVDDFMNVELRKRSTASSSSTPTDKYAKFILLDDSVKGPYNTNGRLWTEAYTEHVVGDVKLQGVTYHCGRGETFIDPSIFATDAEGLRLFMKNGLLECYDSTQEARESVAAFTRLLEENKYRASINTMGIRGQRLRAGTNTRYCLDRMVGSGDVLAGYRGYETMFIKARGSEQVLKTYESHQGDDVRFGDF